MSGTVRNQKQKQPAATTGKCASLSVVVVSSGSASVAQRATLALRSASRDFEAQFILVSQNADPGLAASVERFGAEFVSAPPGSTRAEMCDLGMHRASGCIIAVRDDISVGDAGWMDSYRSVLPPRPAATAVSASKESVIMDTMVARRLAKADGAVSFTGLETRIAAAASEMASAV